MAQGCIFCEIHAGRKPGEILYENEHLFILWDLRQPRMGGHILVIPREHIENLISLPDDLDQMMMHYSKIATRALKKTLNCSGINLMIANGRSAGQTVFHLHIHLLPRNRIIDLFSYYLNAFILHRKLPDTRQQILLQRIREAIATEIQER
jgi:histidine triad (HIT) family protein